MKKDSNDLKQTNPFQLEQLSQLIKTWADELGFDEVGFTDIDLSDAEPGLLAWLKEGHHGKMQFMAKHGLKRARPAELVPGTLRAICVRMSYLPAGAFEIKKNKNTSGSQFTEEKIRIDQLAANSAEKLSEKSANKPTDKLTFRPTPQPVPQPALKISQLNSLTDIQSILSDAAMPSLGTSSYTTHPLSWSFLESKQNDKKTPDWRIQEWQRLNDPLAGSVSIYARGRDYHKVLKQRLNQLAEQIASQVENLGYRVFVDSAPVLEVALANRARLGWRGKNTLLLNKSAGSCFFLGEIFVDIPLPLAAISDNAKRPSFSNQTIKVMQEQIVSEKQANQDFKKQSHVSSNNLKQISLRNLSENSLSNSHCGSCQRCIDVCPTQAIIAPYKIDARRCISYLTIEHPDAIPIEFRAAMGNRIYGCDDCQLICPWNKFAKVSPITDFNVRHQLNNQTLLTFFSWTENDFLHFTEGSAIRRIGHERWLRNVAVGLGNALTHLPNHSLARNSIQQALINCLPEVSPLVAEHIHWALQQA